MIGKGQPQPGSDRVTLVAIDCVNPLHALRALDICLDRMAFADAVFLSDTASEYTLPGCRMVTIPRIDSAADYSRFVVKELGQHVHTSHVLLVQWDGYILEPAAWRQEFLDYDYIGAPWGWYQDSHRVGNGGFSLRSRKLLDALQDPEVADCVPEDEAIGRRYRPLLESRHGIRFAPEPLAAAFSFETTYPPGPTFGFHGLFNMWMVLHPDEVAPFMGALHASVVASPQYLRLAGNYRDAGRLKEAIVVLTRRAQLNPADAEAATLLAQWQGEARVRSPSNPGRTPGRNDPCPCGSGKRYKACCGLIASTPVPARVDPKALLDRAMALHQAGNLAEAEALYRQVLAADAGNFIAVQYLGVLSLQKGDAVAAEALVRRALEQADDIPEFHSNLGLCLRAQGQLEEAVAAYRRAIWLRPDYAAAYNNLGLDLQALGRVDHAVAAFEDAISHAPELAEAHWNLGLALLLQGRFEKGWAEYEWRLRCQPFERHRLVLPGAKPWQGEPLAGRTLLVRQEQGAGDTIQFLRFVPALVEQAVEVVVEIAPELASLAALALPGARIVSRGEATAADFYVNLMSLPLRLGVTLANLPAPEPYLHPYPAAALGWRERLAGLAGRRVGLVWAGNPQHSNDRNRSLSPDTVEPLLTLSGISWVSLQKDRDPPAAWNGRVLSLAQDLRAFDDTAAALSALDLVVSVDTSVAHLAGAMGVPTLLLLPFAPDWRWLLDRRDTPWYRAMRLIRQPTRGDWGAVIREVALELDAARSAAVKSKP